MFFFFGSFKISCIIQNHRGSKHGLKSHNYVVMIGTASILIKRFEFESMQMKKEYVENATLKNKLDNA